MSQPFGNGIERQDLQVHEPVLEGPETDVLAIDEALGHLAREYPAKAELVKMRYFAGLTLPEAASALGISPATADRHWRFARAWLARRLRQNSSPESE